MSYVKVVKYYCITCDQPIYKLCSKFKGNEEDVWLFESPLTEMTGFTLFWDRPQSSLINLD